MTTENLTYKELAVRLGVKQESARKTVQRKRWQRVTGNDGIVRVIVPVDALPQSMDKLSDSHRDSHSDEGGAIIKELQAKIEGLMQVLDAERQRARAAEQDRDRWHDYAVRPWWKRLAG